MLTAFRLIADDRLVAVHRTALTNRGEKIDRMMLGPVAGAAIKIDDNTDVEQGLTIGEGFETCLAARGLGFRPVWALGSAGPIGTFPVLACIDALSILRESDKKGTNAAAAQACARRWIAAGREAFVVNPPQGDMNDLMKPVQPPPGTEHLATMTNTQPKTLPSCARMCRGRPNGRRARTANPTTSRPRRAKNRIRSRNGTPARTSSFHRRGNGCSATSFAASFCLACLPPAPPASPRYACCSSWRWRPGSRFPGSMFSSGRACCS
jgi:hypothetical protein